MTSARAKSGFRGIKELSHKMHKKDRGLWLKKNLGDGMRKYGKPSSHGSTPVTDRHEKNQVERRVGERGARTKECSCQRCSEIPISRGADPTPQHHASLSQCGNSPGKHPRHQPRHPESGRDGLPIREQVDLGLDKYPDLIRISLEEPPDAHGISERHRE